MSQHDMPPPKPLQKNKSTKPAITRHVHTVIIGAGTAGQTAYHAAVKITESVLLINGGDWSTTCARVGCMPSKLLITAANRAYDINTSEVFGLKSTLKVDAKAVMKRVQLERDFFANSVLKTVSLFPDQHKLSGYARFINKNTVQVGEELIQAQKIVIATGGSPLIPEGWAEKIGKRLLTNESIFEIKKLPKSLAVIGSGAQGLELSQAFHRLGVRVKLFNRSEKVGSLTDPALQQHALDVFGQELDLALGTTITDVALTDTPRLQTHTKSKKVQVHITFKNKFGVKQQDTFDYVLCAITRQPNLSALNLSKAGIDLDHRGIPVGYNPTTGQIGRKPIFIAGDVNLYRPVMHEAVFQGRLSGLNAARETRIEKSLPMTPLGVIFSEPQMATVGLNYRQLTESQQPFHIGELDFARQGRARVMAVKHGKLRMYGDAKTERLLGAEMFGPQVEHLAHAVAWMIQHDISIEQMIRNPYYHPTLEEGLRTALLRLKHAMQQTS
ncbi:dihydrolipoyl dehydrogenase [Aquirhabdus sp.]|uniref:dihydrolipoyl dehydrogenase n=1 Tax=Aquirhabdus sp. TaxID=2824160 RepID=UPI00396CF3C0